MNIFDNLNLLDSEFFDKFTHAISQMSMFKNGSVYIEGFFVYSSRDRYYIIFSFNNRKYALISTDHPEPLFESRELKQLSKKYYFKTIFNLDGREIDLYKVNIELLDGFFIRNSKEYYYCAIVSE